MQLNVSHNALNEQMVYLESVIYFLLDVGNWFLIYIGNTFVIKGVQMYNLKKKEPGIIKQFPV